MFSLFQRKKIVDLSPYIRRICDLTAPNVPVTQCDRVDNRYNRSIPALVCPWEEEQPLGDAAEIVLTRDISDSGIGLIHTKPIELHDILIGFWLSVSEMEEPWFFKATVQINQPIGGQFWIIGTRLDEYMNAEHRQILSPLFPRAKSLLPP